MAKSLHGKFYVGRSKQRIDGSGIESQRVVRRFAGHRSKPAHVADIELFRLPGFEAFFDLFRKAIRISRGAECLASQNGGRLVMAVTIAVGPRESRDQYVGTKSSNHSNHISQRNVMPLPLLEGFVGIFRISEVGYPRESLFDSVITVCRQKLKCAQHAQRVKQIAA